MKRIAVLNLTRMGDLLMTGPMLDRLREVQPQAELHLIVVKGFQDVAEGLGADRVLTLDYDLLSTLAVRGFQHPEQQGLVSLLEQMRGLLEPVSSMDYDAIYNISHTRISAVLTSLMRGPVKGGLHLDRQGYRRIAGDWARYFFAGNLHRELSAFHLVDMNRELVGSQPQLGKVSRMAVTLAADTDGLLADDEAARYVAFQCGASSPDKRWEAKKFADLASKLVASQGIVPLFVGSAGEKDLVDQAAQMAGEGAINLAGKTTLGQLASLLERCELLVTNDTGTMHLAQSVGTPSLAITLGSALSDETGPYGAGNLIVEPRIACFPCSARSTCSHLSCHDRIEPALIAALASSMLDGSDPLQVVEEHKEQAVVWRTGFDNRGWWSKRPLLPLGTDLPRAAKQLYRLLLREELSGGGANPSDCRRLGEDIDEELEALFGVKAGEQKRLLGQRLASELELIRGAVSRALGHALELRTLAESGLHELERMAELSDELSELAQKLFRQTLGESLWRPLLLLLRFDLENLPEEGLLEQAEATWAAYDRLSRLFEITRQLLLPIENDTGEAMSSAGGGFDRSEGASISTMGNDSSRAASFSQPARQCASSASLDRLIRPRMRQERLSILLPSNGYFLQGELARCLEGMGHRVLPLDLRSEEDLLQRLLLASVEADLLLTVNHIGFDSDGAVAQLLSRIGLPWASWFVDHPGFILLDAVVEDHETAHIYTWEDATRKELKAYGYENASYLPLAGDPQAMGARPGGTLREGIHFVGNSMLAATREWTRRAGYTGARRQELDRLVEALRRSRRAPLDELALSRGGNTEEAAARWSRDDLERASALALAATGVERKALVSAFEARGLLVDIYGDEGWQQQALQSPWRGSVDYGSDLRELYRNRLHLNQTSYQMPTAVNQRVFDVPLAGGIVLTDAQQALGELFDLDRECLVYGDKAEAVELARRVHEQPDEAHRRMRRARERILKEHTYRHRIERVLADVKKRFGRVQVVAEGGC